MNTTPESYQSATSSEVLNTMLVKSYFFLPIDQIIYLVLPMKHQVKLEWPQERVRCNILT